MKKRNAIIVAMTAITGANFAQENKAMQAAMDDMRAEGMDVYVEYTWDPFDGMLA